MNIREEIAGRLCRRYGIVLNEHIQSIKKIGHNLGVGITFIPKDHVRLTEAIKGAGFAHDDRRHIFDAIAASQTNGEGYREPGVPSLHCAITSGSCNIHLDTYGFVSVDSDGNKYYNPDLIQHIVDDLGWALVANFAYKQNPTVGNMLGRIHPITPHYKNNYKPAIGVKLDLKKGKGWGLAIEATQSLSGEKSVQGKLDILKF